MAHLPLPQFLKTVSRRRPKSGGKMTIVGVKMASGKVKCRGEKILRSCLGVGLLLSNGGGRLSCMKQNSKQQQ